MNAHKNEQRKCNVCTKKNNNRAELKPEKNARGRVEKERESASSNYDFGSLLLFFLAYFSRKTQKRYMKLSRSKFPRIIYVRKDKNKKNVETSVKAAQREAPN